MSNITKQTREMLAKMAGNNMQLIRWLEGLGDISSSVPGEIAAIQAQIDQINIEINAIEQNLLDVDVEIALLEAQIVEMQAEIDAFADLVVGEVEIDFGASPGLNEASITVADVRAESDWYINVFAMASDTTADHDETDHRYLGLFANFSAAVDPGVGFTIHATCPDPLQGAFKLRYERVN